MHFKYVKFTVITAICLQLQATEAYMPELILQLWLTGRVTCHLAGFILCLNSCFWWLCIRISGIGKLFVEMWGSRFT